MLGSTDQRAGAQRVALTVIVLAAVILGVRPSSAGAEGEYQRLAGRDRVETAVAASGMWESSEDAVLAAATDFPDALAAGALTAELGAPLLLTRGAALAGAVIEELARLETSTVHIVGGEAAISRGVEQELESLGMTIERYAGADRYATAAEVARSVGAPTGESTLAVGTDFPDAVSAGTLAASPSRLPVLLTRPSQLPEATTEALDDLDIAHVYVMGGGSAVRDDVVDTLVRDEGQPGGRTARRLAGADRYRTSEAAAAEALERRDGAVPLVLATGDAFPDALAGTAVAARLSGVLLLTPGDSVNAHTLEFIEERPERFTDVYVLGGPSAISNEVAERLHQAATSIDPSNVLGGIVTEDTTLAGRFLVERTLQVPEGVTLTVAPGSELINAHEESMFFVRGRVEVAGSPDRPVILRALDGRTSLARADGLDAQMSVRHAEVHDFWELGLPPRGFTLSDSRLVDVSRPSGLRQDSTVSRNVFERSAGFSLRGASEIVNNRFESYPGDGLGLWLSLSGDPDGVVIRHNSFLDLESGAQIIMAEGTGSQLEQVTYDAADNWWGTTDAQMIQDRIRDARSDLELNGIFSFEPFLSRPHPDTP